MNTIRVIFYSLILALFMTSTAGAATLTVDDDGVECVGAPFATISAALAASSNGDTIQVCDGAYSEGTIVVSTEVIIDGLNRDSTFINVTATSAIGLNVQVSNVTISDLTIREIEGGGVTSAQGIRYSSGGGTLNNESVDNVVFADFDGGSARGIEINDGTLNNLSVTDSIFRDNDTGIRMSSISTVDGFDLMGSTFTATSFGAPFVRIGVYQANDGGISTLTNFQAMNNIFENQSLAGIFVEEIQDSTISGNVFSGSYTGIIINKAASTSGVSVNDVLITDNDFTDHTGRAIFFGSAGAGLGSGVVISDNRISQSVGALTGNRGAITTNFPSALSHALLEITGNTFTYSGLFSGGASTTWGIHLSGDGPVEITQNQFKGANIISSGTPPFAAIYIESNHSSRGLREDPVTITGNDIMNFVHGITVYDDAGAAGGLPGGVMIDVHVNNIVGNSAFGIFNGTTPGMSEPIDATDNWWGDSSGPGGEGPGSGDAISENVIVTPFLVSPQSNNVVLSIIKTVNADQVDRGSDVTFTISVTNNGIENANGVVVTDILDVSLIDATSTGCAESPVTGPTCTIGTVAAGTTSVVMITATVDINAPATIRNTASVTADDVAPDAIDDSSTVEVSVGLVAVPLMGPIGLLLMMIALAFAGVFAIGRFGR